MITEGSAAHPVRLGDIIWGLHLKEVHWPPSAPIVLVDMEGGPFRPDVGNLNIEFIDVPKDGDTITINGTKVTFGSGGEVVLGAGAAASAVNFTNYLNTVPHPVSQVMAVVDGVNVRLDWDTDKLTLSKSSTALNVIGTSFTEEPPLEMGVVITKEMYDGLSMYDPYGNAGLFNVGSDLIYITYSGAGSGATINNVHVGRFHKAVLVNMSLAAPVVEIDVVSQNQNNYAFVFPKAWPLRIMQPIDNNFVITAYAPGTEFKVGAGGTITTEAASLWAFSKTITVQDTRGAPADSSLAVDDYNAIGNSPPFPFGRVKFDKNGEVAG